MADYETIRSIRVIDFDNLDYDSLCPGEAAIVCKFRGQTTTLGEVIKKADAGDVISGLPIDCLLYNKIVGCIEKRRREKEGKDNRVFYRHIQKNHDVIIFEHRQRRS